MKFFRKTAGSVSLFLILVLLPLYTCLYLAIDSARWSAAKAKMSGAMNLTGNAALNTYEVALKDCYGLFAMGTSEGTFQKDLLAIYSGTVESGNYENYINPAVDAFSVTYVDSSSVARPAVMKYLITDYMKYRAPYNFATGIAKRLDVFSQAPSAANVLEKSTDYYSDLKSVTGVLEDVAEDVQKEEEKIAENEKKASEEASKEEEPKNYYDADGQKRIVKALQSSLKSLRKKVKKTEESASAWKGALDSMSEGEAKALLSGDYQSTAGILSEESINSLEQDLETDLNTLNSYEDGQPDPTLHYPENPLYQYIRSAASVEAEESETASAKSTYSALKSAAGTDVSGMVSDVGGSVSSLVGSEGSAIDAAGDGSGSGIAVSSGGTDSGTLLAMVKNGLSGLQSLATDLRDDAFAEEYINGMFSCYTNTATDTSMTKTAYGGKPLFRAETEYIIFGQDSAKANVLLCATSIFAIRFVLNSIYVFSNARMRAEAMTIAAAIAGWTGAGVTVVQNLILTAWAMAESVLDVSTLLKGGTVPVYKTATTWTLGVNGIAEKLKDGAQSVAVNSIDSVFQKIQEAADDKVGEIGSAATDYFNESAKGAAESLTNMVTSPVEATITSLIGDRTKSMTGKSRDEIRSLIQKAVASADNGSKGFAMAKSLFEQHCLDSLTDRIYGNYEYLFADDETLSKLASQKLEEAITSCYNTLYSKVEAGVDQVVSGAQGKLDTALNNASEEAKARAVEVIDEYTETLSGLLGKESSPTTTAVSSYSGMAMSYRDYLRLFTFLGLIGNKAENGMMTRIAKVIQINCSKVTSGFRISRCFTQVTLDAKVGIAAHKLEEEVVYHY